VCSSDLTRPPPNTNHPHEEPTIAHLIEALTTNDHHIKSLIQTLPNNWSNYNTSGSLITKRQLLQCAWGELKESGSLQAFQQAIITTIPPPTVTVTQYHTRLTFAICVDNTVRQHTIHNACQDQVLSPPSISPDHHIQHTPQLPLHNPYHEQPRILLLRLLNLRQPPVINMIHNSLRQWYSG